MNKAQIDRFFQALAGELDEPARIILTGAAAGSLMGSKRPSVDIDFAIELARKDRRLWSKVTGAVERASRMTATETNYLDDIDRWGTITLLDYRKHARPYRRFGKLTVSVLDPVYWSIGKITRYLDPDIGDLEAVLRRQRVRPEALTQLWAKALRKSPLSPALVLFRKQAEHFLRRSGPRIWGRKFNPEKTIKAFNDAL